MLPLPELQNDFVRGLGAPLLRGLGERRKLSVRRIDDERRAVVPLALRHPKLVVVPRRRVVRDLLVLALVPGVEQLLDEVAEDGVA